MKKGFTLTEVLVVIIILSIIILMAVPAYLGITETLKQKEYDNKITQIEIKATEWATDNNITEDTTIPLSKLINEGYIQMDDETSLDRRVINPLNGESMECYHVNIQVENDTYNAKVEESNDCELKELEEQDNNINVVGYEIDSATNKILNTTPLKISGGELPWTGKDILLVTNSDIYKEPKSITYSSGGNENKKTGSMYLKEPEANEVIEVDKYQNVLVVTTSVILRSKYTITYEMGNETPKKKVLVKIDKENPTGEASMLEKWGTSANKKVLLSGSDGVGSGVKGFYVSKDQNINNATFYEAKENKKEVSLDLGIYYYWTEDQVGNKSQEGKELVVNNIDDKGPECVYPVERTKWSKNKYTITWGCKDNESGCITNTQGWTKTFESGTVGSYSLKAFEIEDAAGNKTVCPAKQISIMLDTEGPSCNIKTPAKIGKNNWYIENAVLTLETKDTGSGLKSKGLSTKNTVDYNNKTKVTQKSTKGVTYYGYVEDNLGNKNECSLELKVDSVAPSCLVPKGNSTWTNKAVKIEWGCSDATSGCTTKTQTKTFNQQNITQKTYTVYNGNATEKGVKGEYIYDEAGNKTFCAVKDIPINYDAEKPSCQAVKVANTLNTPDGVTVNVTCSDKTTGSGIAKCAGESNKTSYSQSGVKTSQANVTETKKYTVEDKVGNKNECSVDVTSYTTYRNHTRGYATCPNDDCTCLSWNQACASYGTKCGSYGTKCTSYGTKCAAYGTKTKYKYRAKCIFKPSGRTLSISSKYIYNSHLEAEAAAASDCASRGAQQTIILDVPYESIPDYNNCLNNVPDYNNCTSWKNTTCASRASCVSSKCGFASWSAWTGYDVNNYCNTDFCKSESQVWYK